MGGIADAIAGNRIGEAIAEFAGELLQETGPSFSLGLGVDTKAMSYLSIALARSYRHYQDLR